MRTLLLVLVALTLPLPVAAQAPTSPQASDVVTALNPGQRVRLLAPGISIENGTVVSVSPDLLSVLEDSQQWQVDPSLVERLQVQERGTSRLALTGALFGAALGFGMGYFYNMLSCDTGGGCGNRVIVSSGIVGTLIGAGGGAAIGHSTVRWRQRFP